MRAFQGSLRAGNLAPGQEAADLIRKIYLEWCRNDIANRAAFTFFTIGSACRWSEQVLGSASGDHWLVISSLSPDGVWETRTPPRFADRLSLRNFLDRLKPETRQQRISRIKHFVDELLDSGYEGNILLDKVANETGYRRSAVRDTLLALQNSAHYRLYKTAEGLLAVGRKTGTLGTSITTADFHRSWLSHLACLTPAVTVGIWFVKDWILGRPFSARAVLALVPLVYAGEWLSTRLRKWRGNKE